MKRVAQSVQWRKTQSFQHSQVKLAVTNTREGPLVTPAGAMVERGGLGRPDADRVQGRRQVVPLTLVIMWNVHLPPAYNLFFTVAPNSRANRSSLNRFDDSELVPYVRRVRLATTKLRTATSAAPMTSSTSGGHNISGLAYGAQR